MRFLLLIGWASLRVLAQTPSTPPKNPPPTYAASSIVNAATPRLQQFAPGTLATIYGSHLSLVTRAMAPEDIRNGELPSALPGTGVRVLVGASPARLLYVSPGQINFLIPSEIELGSAELRVTLDALPGPAVRLPIAEAAPALFQADPEYAVATWQDDVVSLYATGLGRTAPPLRNGQLAPVPLPLEKLSSFRVEVGGTELQPEAVLYAGAAPGFAGLYQINVRMREMPDPDPEVRISIGAARSPEGVKLKIPR